MRVSRRKLLGGCLSGSALALAGCTGGADSESDGEMSEEGSANLRIGQQFLRSTFPMEIYELGTDDLVVQVHWHGQLSNSHWHQQPLSVPLERPKSYELRAYDIEDNEIQFGEDQPLQLVMVRTEETPEDHVEPDISGSTINIRGQNSGTGQYALRIISGEQLEWESPLLLVTVD